MLSYTYKKKTTHAATVCPMETPDVWQPVGPEELSPWILKSEMRGLNFCMFLCLEDAAQRKLEILLHKKPEQNQKGSSCCRKINPSI